jgi:class II lanthipeptide synthase
MDAFRDQVSDAIRAIRIVSPTRFAWFDEPSPRLAARVERRLDALSARQLLVATLVGRLYQSFYCTGAAVPSQRDGLPPVSHGSAPFLRRLSRANAGQGGREDGWRLCEESKAGVLIERGGLRVRARREDCRLTAGGGLVPGATLSLPRPKELRNASPGFYTALGDAPMAGSRCLVRLYFNLTPAGAVLLIRDLTRRLNRQQVPFHLKVLGDPAGFTRCDAAVLYLRQEDWLPVRRAVAALSRKLGHHLRQRTPAFALALAAGIGLAEDPGEGESFGLHRCGLLAEGLVDAWESSARDEGERLARVEERFRGAGLDLGAPFLNRGSRGRYRLGEAATRNRPKVDRLPLGKAGDERFLDAAARIARQLAGEALWAVDRCNWIGPSAEATLGGSPGSPGYESLGPDLYAGTSGVALFLGSFNRLAGDDRDVRRTALGALRQAVRCALAPEGVPTWGLFSGRIGIALAGARLWRLLDAEECAHWAREIVGGRSPRFDEPFDLLSGRAGAVLGLLALARLLDDHDCRRLACHLGDEIVAGARADGSGGLSWPSAVHCARRDLTGLSHGAAGVGWALLELFDASGDERYRLAAEGAFAYERRWFDGERGNWLDFRLGAHDASDPKRPACASHWCHGAPGIVLSRLRAYQLLARPTHLEEARAGLETTRRTVEEATREGSGNYSLCHGMGGNSDVLLEAARTLGDAAAQDLSAAVAAGLAGLRRYGRGGIPWPCGGRGPSPGLMLGLAGIGQFYLRLYRPGEVEATRVWL